MSPAPISAARWLPTRLPVVASDDRTGRLAERLGLEPRFPVLETGVLIPFGRSPQMVELGAGLEPATFSLRVSGSAVELPQQCRSTTPKAVLRLIRRERSGTFVQDQLAAPARSRETSEDVAISSGSNCQASIVITSDPPKLTSADVPFPRITSPRMPAIAG